MHVWSAASKSIDDAASRFQLNTLAHAGQAVKVGLLALGLALAATVAQAGVEVELTSKDYRSAAAGAEPDGRAGAMRMQDGNLWMDLGLGESGKNASIYRAADKSLLVIDHERKTYSVMDDKAIGMIVDEMQLAMMQLDQRMAQLPPEQRQLLQGALKGDPRSRLPHKVERTSEVATVSGFATRKFDVFQGEEKIREVWVAEWSKVPESQDVLRSLQGVDELFRSMKAAFDSVASGVLGGARPFDVGESPFQDLQAMDGFPVRTRNYENGTLVSETEVVAIRQQTFEAETFEAPADYEKKVMRGE